MLRTARTLTGAVLLASACGSQRDADVGSRSIDEPGALSADDTDPATPNSTPIGERSDPDTAPETVSETTVASSPPGTPQPVEGGVGATLRNLDNPCSLLSIALEMVGTQGVECPAADGAADADCFSRALADSLGAFTIIPLQGIDSIVGRAIVMTPLGRTFYFSFDGPDASGGWQPQHVTWSSCPPFDGSAPCSAPDDWETLCDSSGRTAELCPPADPSIGCVKR